MIKLLPSCISQDQIKQHAMPSTTLFIIGTLLLSLNFVELFGFAIQEWLYFDALGFDYKENNG